MKYRYTVEIFLHAETQDEADQVLSLALAEDDTIESYRTLERKELKG